MYVYICDGTCNMGVVRTVPYSSAQASAPAPKPHLMSWTCASVLAHNQTEWTIGIALFLLPCMLVVYVCLLRLANRDCHNNSGCVTLIHGVMLAKSVHKLFKEARTLLGTGIGGCNDCPTNDAVNDLTYQDVAGGTGPAWFFWSQSGSPVVLDFDLNSLL